MKPAPQELLAQAKELKQHLVAIRRSIHRHPELGMEEERTSALIQQELERLGIPFEANVAGIPAVVGLIEGEGRVPEESDSLPCIALRADMDALPIQEQNDVEYASTIPGKMHACGHDGHVAALLGAAALLKGLAPTLPGNVKLLFQPAEEGPGGARPMVEAGVLENPKVHAVIGQHVGNLLQVGQVGLRSGATYAAADVFAITITGSGGHAAHPEQTADALVCGAQLVTALQTIVSREVGAVMPAVVTVGVFQAGYRENVIADKAVLRGTVRTTNSELRGTMPERIERLSKQVAAAFRCQADVEYHQGPPPGYNDPALTRGVKQTLERMVGPDNVIEAPITMGAEDFSYFSQAVPGTFYGLGSGNRDKGLNKPGHHPQFDFDEDALPYGAALFAAIAVDYLNGAEGYPRP